VNCIWVYEWRGRQANGPREQLPEKCQLIRPGIENRLNRLRLSKAAQSIFGHLPGIAVKARHSGRSQWRLSCIRRESPQLELFWWVIMGSNIDRCNAKPEYRWPSACCNRNSRSRRGPGRHMGSHASQTATITTGPNPFGLGFGYRLASRYRLIARRFQRSLKKRIHHNVEAYENSSKCLGNNAPG